MKILVVEDDQTVAQSLKFLFSNYNYAVDIAADGETGLQMADAFEYDLILLDVMLPRLDGINVCKHLRAKGFRKPVLLLTGQGEGRQKAVALNAGADDYVVKPFDAEELIARVQALLRRGSLANQPILTWGNLSIDPSSRKVAFGTQLMSVTPKEYAILELFLRDPHKVLSAAAILDRVWSSVESPGEEAVRVHIKGLRQKFQAVGAPKDLIKTVYRVGYQLNPQYSNFLAAQVEQQPTALNIAELTVVNEELRLTVEELQVAEEELRQQNEELESIRQTLELERQRYQDLFEFAPDAYLVTDLHGDIQEANRAASSLLDVSFQYLIGKPLVTFIARSDRSDFRRRLANLNFVQNWEVDVQPKAGEPFSVLIAVTSIKNLQNEIVGLRWLLRDIRPRKILEQQLQAAHDELEIRVAERTAELVTTIQSLQQQQTQRQSLFDQALDAIAIADDGGHYIDANPAACELFGVSREELLRSSVADFADPKLDVAQVWQQFLQQGQMSGEFCLYRPDGTTRETEFNAIANFVPGRHLSILRDVTERKRAETAIQESGEQFRLALDLTHIGAWDWDIITGAVTWTTNQYHLFGYPIGEVEVSYQLWRDRVHPEDIDWVEQAVTEALETQRDINVEYRVVLPDGATRWILTKGRGVYNELGQPVRMVGFNFDTSDRKQLEAEHLQAETTLRLSEEQRRLALDLTNTATWDLDIATGTVIWSDHMFRLFGLERAAEPSYLLWRQCVHPDDIGRLETQVQIHLQNQTLYSEEYRVIHPDGSVHWVLSKGHGVYDADGRAVRMIGITMDITDRKQAEVALRESEEKYRSLFNSIDEGYVLVKVIFDENDYPIDLLYLDANPAAVRMTGTELVGRRTRELDPNFEEQWFEVCGRVAKTGVGERHEFYTAPLQAWYNFYVFKAGEPDSRQVALIYQDVTDRKRREANAAFLADIAEECSRLSSVEEITQAVGAKIGAYLNVIACNFCEIDEVQDEVVYFGRWNKEDILRLPDRICLSEQVSEEFCRRAHAGETIVSTNTQTNSITNAQANAAIQVHSFITVPFHKNGEWKYLFSIHDSVSRNWREDEIELMRELANRLFPRLERARIEADLRENEQLLQLALAGAQAGSWDWEIATGQITWSPENYILYGIDPTHCPVQYEDWMNALHPEDRERVNRQVLQLIENRIPKLQSEFRIIHPQWGVRWLLGLGHLTLNEQGEPVRVSGINLDITDRKQAEIEVLQREEFLNSIYTGVEQAVFVIEVVDGGQDFRYLDFNPVSERYSTLTCQQVKGKTPEEAFGQVQGAILRQNYERCLQADQKIIYEEEIAFPGQTIWTLTTLFPFKNEQGETYRIIGTGINITDRKRLELSLQASEAKLSQILDSAIAAISSFRVYANRDWEYEYWSAGCERLFGYPLEDYADKYFWLSQVHPDDLEQLIVPLFDTFFAEQDITIEYRFRRKDGLMRWFASSYTSRKIADDCWVVTTVNYDITDRKQAELETRKFISLADNSTEFIAICDMNFVPFYVNPAGIQMVGLDDVQSYSETPVREFFFPEDQDFIIHEFFPRVLHEGRAEVEVRFRHFKTGEALWMVYSVFYIQDENKQPIGLATISRNISDRKYSEIALQQQILQAQLIADISQDIRYSLDLNNVLSRTVERVRELLNTDRVIIFRFYTDWQGEVIMESVGADWDSILSTTIFDSCFSDRYIELYRQGRIAALSDVDRSGLEPCYVELLKSFQVKANLIVPILRNEDLWGLLVAHHCSIPRQWQSSEIELLRQLATHVEIAIHQSELYEQTRQELLERERMQIVLEESEERFRSLSTAAPIGICQTNADGICLYVNECWQQMTGLSFEDCLGYGWIQAIHPDDRAFFTTWEAYLRGEDEYLPEFRFLTPQGEIRWISARVATMKSATDEIIGYVSTCEDITERKQSEIQLREISTALSYTVEGISHLDEQGRYISVNEAYAHMTGYTPDEMIGMQWQNTVHPDDLEHLAEAYQSMLRQGKVELEARGLRKDGSVFYKHLSMVAAYNEKQQFTGHYCFMKDISERKQMEADRKLAEQKIREQAALLDITSDAIFVHDLDFRILYWNQSAERLYGWQATEAIGQKADELLHINPTHLIQEIMEMLMKQGSWRGEIHKVTKTGKQVIIEARWTLVRDEAAQPKHILSVDTDITEKKQLEAQFYRAQRLESLGTLASGIAHDLNNVLTPILAIAQLLRLHRPIAEDQLQEMLKVLEDSAKRGADMIKQILTFTRGTGGERSPVQITPLLQEVVNVIQQTFPKSINIHKVVPEQSLWVVSADPTYLHQVLMNLCVNARDAMPDGGTLTLSAKNFYVDQHFAQRNLDAQIGNYVMITIADTGSGIPADVRDRIFEPFFTTKAVGQGTGLGLSTVLGIIKSYDGFVEVQSQLGTGSQFKVYLPAIETAAQPLERQADLPQGHGELILIVDDEALILQSTQTILETYNYRVVTACNGADAVACYAEHQDQIYAVLIDMMMPEMDGLTAIRALQAMNPQIKIIATSGLAGQYRQSLQTLGITTLLIKPFTTAELLHSLHTQ